MAAAPSAPLPAMSAAPATSPPAPSSRPWLPSPALYADSALGARAHALAATAPYLTPPLRLVLAACLPYMQPPILERALALDSPALALLAHTLLRGLTAARNWGGSSQHKSPRQRQPHTTNTPPPPPQPPVPPVDPPPTSPLEALLIALGLPVDTLRPTTDMLSSKAVIARRKSQRKGCESRHDGRCPVTGADDPECIHLIPYSAAAVRSPDASFFWLFLLVLFGKKTRDTLFTLVGEDRSFSPSNALLLNSALHKRLDRGLLWLAPVQGGCTPDQDDSLSPLCSGGDVDKKHGDPAIKVPSPACDSSAPSGPGPSDLVHLEHGHSNPVEPDDVAVTQIPADARVYDLELHWMAPLEELQRWTTSIAKDPRRQVAFDGSRYRPLPPSNPRYLAHGDRFRLYTNDVLRHPNPHPMLLELRVLLWTMINISGLGETVKDKRKRKVSDRTADDDDEDIDGDSDADDQSVAGSEHQPHRSVQDRRPGKRSRAGQLRREKKTGGAGPLNSAHMTATGTTKPQRDLADAGFSYTKKWLGVTATAQPQDSSSDLHRPGKTMPTAPTTPSSSSDTYYIPDLPLTLNEELDTDLAFDPFVLRQLQEYLAELKQLRSVAVKKTKHTISDHDSRRGEVCSSSGSSSGDYDDEEDYSESDDGDIHTDPLVVTQWQQFVGRR